MCLEVSPPVGALSKRAGHPKRGYSLSLQVLLECKARGYKPRLPRSPKGRRAFQARRPFNARGYKPRLPAELRCRFTPQIFG